MKNPIQPLENINGMIRFKENKIVRYLLDNGGIDLNKLAVMDFDDNDREQLSQLIGYSLSGYGDLSHVSDESYYVAEAMLKDPKTNDLQERYNHLCMELDNIKVGLKMAAVSAFRVHPDDLN